MIANEKLVQKAVKAQQIRNRLVKDVGFQEDQWVLVRAESRNKFEGRWFGPYRIDKKMLLGTYRLADPEGNVVKNLINGQRLVTANIPDGKTVSKLWNSSRIQGTLRKHRVDLTAPSPEVAELFEKDNADTPSYDELASIPAKEWKKLMENCTGDSSGQVGEEMQGHDLSQPTAADLGALQKGVKEGLEEGRSDLADRPQAVEQVDRPQAITEADRPEAINLADRPEAIDLADRPQAIELADRPQAVADPREENVIMDIDQDMEDTTSDALILEPTAQCEQELGPMDVDGLEGSVEPPMAPKSTRIPSWRRELTASTAERERVASPYGLRQRPPKRITQD
jgi:hypothetical protein